MQATRRTPRRTPRNSSGEWTTATPSNQIQARLDDAIEEQRQGTSPEQNAANAQSQTFNIVTLKRWRAEPTTNRTQICLWTLILVAKVISILTMICFWISLFMWLKTLLVWQGIPRIINGLIRRHEGKSIGIEDTLWEDVFPMLESTKSYQLYWGLTTPLSLVACDVTKLLYLAKFAILFNNPVIWTIAVVALFTNYHLLSFVHDCLQQASRAMKALAA